MGNKDRRNRNIESFQARLHRFLFNSPEEIFFTILNSISNFTLPELRVAIEADLYNLAFLGAHSVMQTISEQIYGKTGLKATRFYLENFVDGQTEDTRFSAIAEALHSFRNVHAHRWSSRLSHAVGFDTAIKGGWRRDGKDLHVNPIIFMEYFSAGFKAGGAMWIMPRKLDQLTALRRKYRYLRQWLELPKKDPILYDIRSLENCDDLGAAQKQEAAIQTLLTRRFGLCGK